MIGRLFILLALLGSVAYPQITTVPGANTGNATKLQGRNICATAPTNGQSVVWDLSSNCWKPSTITGGGGGSSNTYVAGLTGNSTYTVTHNRGTSLVSIACYDASSMTALAPRWTPVTSNQITLNFSVTTAATCSISGGSSDYNFALTASSTTTVLGTTHNLGRVPRVTCVNSSNVPVDPTFSVNSTNYNTTLGFSPAFTGNCSFQ
jgi:hypothetical protein